MTRKKHLLLFISTLWCYSAVKPIEYFWKGNYANVTKIRSQWFYELADKNIFVKALKTVTRNKKTTIFRLARKDEISPDKKSPRPSYDYFILKEDAQKLDKIVLCLKKIENNPQFISSENLKMCVCISNKHYFVVDWQHEETILGNSWFKIQGIMFYSEEAEKDKWNFFDSSSYEFKMEWTFCFGLQLSGWIRNDLFYALPKTKITRPIALGAFYFLEVCFLKKTIYKWFLSKPINYFLRKQKKMCYKKAPTILTKKI